MSLESELKKNTEALERNNALLEQLLNSKVLAAETEEIAAAAGQDVEPPPENAKQDTAPLPPVEENTAPPPPTVTEPVQEQTGYQGTREELFKLTQAKFDETKNEGAIRDLLKSFGCNGIHDLPEDKFVEFAAKLAEVKPI